MSITIPLTQGKVALIDDCDAELVLAHHWYAVCNNGLWYAARHERKPHRRGQDTRRVIQMHRVIAGVPDGVLVDHISGDGLDNRRSNLRPATHGQNKANTERYANNQSGFKGVYRKGRSANPWNAQLRHDSVLLHLGCFATPEEAARAYDAKARELHGVYARCNFPPP